jgi:hypothetical protein
MQIEDSRAAPTVDPAPKDQVRAAADTQGGPSRSGKRFQDALKRAACGSSDDATAPEAASAAAMAGWFRSEPPAVTANAPGKTTGGAAVTGARSVDRVLIGSGPDGPQARIRIGTGALAGTEIQLSGGAHGHAVEARLLTHAATSRQTLSVVMDEIRLRLMDRGIVLSLGRGATGVPVATSDVADRGADAPRARGTSPSGARR